MPIDIEEDTSLSFDSLQLIPENYQVFCNGKEIVLTGKERNFKHSRYFHTIYKFVARLLKNPTLLFPVFQNLCR